MGKKIKEVDKYIDNAGDFAQPILKKLRRLFHQASPKVDEVIKWGCPHFEYNGLVGGLAAFKKHASLGFWKSKEMSDPQNLFSRAPRASMCGIKFTSIDDLPSDAVLLKYMRAAIKLNEPGAPQKKKVAKEKAARPKPKVPAILAAALKKNKKAQATFDEFSPSCQREYVEWITEAKRDATKETRVATAIEWMAEGKRRNWKYENC